MVAERLYTGAGRAVDNGKDARDRGVAEDDLITRAALGEPAPARPHPPHQRRRSTTGNVAPVVAHRRRPEGVADRQAREPTAPPGALRRPRRAGRGQGDRVGTGYCS